MEAQSEGFGEIPVESEILCNAPRDEAPTLNRLDSNTQLSSITPWTLGSLSAMQHETCSRRKTQILRLRLGLEDCSS